MAELPPIDVCQRALATRDASFDGRFVASTATTGIYCRPSCPAPAAKPANLRFFATAEEAREAGFRACLRCNPS